MKSCPLCGFQFSQEEAKDPCQSCPLGGHCALLCCPNCGYSIPEEPSWLQSLIRLWKRKKHSEPKDFLENCTVASLVPGQTAEIFELLSKDKAILQKLASLGLLPGARLKLLRRFPCFLLQTGYAQLALDRRLAMSIAIKPLDEVNPIATYNAKSAA